MWKSLAEEVTGYLQEHCRNADGVRSQRFQSKVDGVKNSTWMAGYRTKLQRLAGILRGDSENTIRYWTTRTQMQLAEEFEKQLSAVLDDDLNTKV